jgi:hypothetical protein
VQIPEESLANQRPLKKLLVSEKASTSDLEI